MKGVSQRARSKSRARRRTQKLSHSMSMISEQAPSTKRTSSTSMNKTRQHAKQIANLVQDSGFQVDFGAAFGGANLFGDEPTESTTHNDDFFNSDPFASEIFSKNQQVDVFSDPGASENIVRVKGLSSSARKVSRQRGRSEATASNQRTTSSRTIEGTSSGGDHTAGTPTQSKERTSPQRTPSQRSTTSQRTPNSLNGSMVSNTSNVSSSAVARRRMRTSMRQKETPTKDASFTNQQDSSGSSDGLFGSGHGFSFDAFGLDGEAMDLQVGAAMNDLAGTHPGLFGFESDSSDGFADGFMVSKTPTKNILPSLIRQSPVSTEKSSLTSEENGKTNIFKQAANFHKTRIPPSSMKMEKVISPERNVEKQPVLDDSSTEFKDPPLDLDGGFASEFSDGGFDSDPFSNTKKPSSVKTESTANTTQHEEKKDENFGKIRNRWENVQKTQPRKNVRPKPNSLPKSQIHKLQDQLGSELLSPEKLESEKFAVKDWDVPSQNEWEPAMQNKYRQSENRPSPRKPHQVDDWPEPPQTSPRRNARSDGGAAVRHSGVSAALSKIEKMEARSDVGKSPSFKGAQLRRTGYSFENDDTTKDPPLTPIRSPESSKKSFESQAMRLVRQSLDGSPLHNINSPKRSPDQRMPRKQLEQSFGFDDTHPQRKSSSPKTPLTYRERRELEVKRQREEQGELRKSQNEVPPKGNVTELIRQRVAASNQNNAVNDQSTSPRHNTRNEHRPIRSRDETPPSPRNDAQLEVESQTEEKTKKPVGRVQASGTVAHMLMMQQIQRQPEKADDDKHGNQSQPRDLRITATGSHDSGDHPFGDHPQRTTPKATKMMLNAFLHGRLSVGSTDGPEGGAQRKKDQTDAGAKEKPAFPPLKDDPAYARYFKMLSMGLPMEVVKHAMTRDGLDPSVMDGDHNKPVGIPLKDDPEYAKYFRMLKIGLHLEAVKHAMERDGLNSSVMDQDHNLPVRKAATAIMEEPKEQDSHRRARLHWNTLRKVTSNSLWAQIDQDSDLDIEIDEDEFQELFQADKKKSSAASTSKAVVKRTTSVCVIDPKRANNGGIILARLKMSHDDMADAVDRIDEQALNPEQIEHIIEYLPTKEERKSLENYMLLGGQDAAEKFDALCECEKFMVSMMTVKHAKRKVSALLFRLRFENAIRDIHKDASAIEKACEELISSTRLKTLLGYILTFGNRLNMAGNGKRKAGAFTIDSLLKLRQAKAFDKKTTFLHYIVLIVMRNNKGILDFKDDLKGVFAADKVFWDQCVTDLEEVENQLENVRKIALYQAKQALSYRFRRSTKKKDDEEETLTDNEESMTLEEEVEALRATPIGVFALSAIKYVSALRDKVEGTKQKFSRLLEYFGEQESGMQPHELFETMVKFSRDFDKAKAEVVEQEKKKLREEKVRLSATQTPSKSSRGMLMKASNHQPSMSSVLKELKSSPVPFRRTSSDVPAPSTEPKPRRTPQEVRSDVGGHTSPRRASPKVNPYNTPEAGRSFDRTPQGSREPRTSPRHLDHNTFETSTRKGVSMDATPSSDLSQANISMTAMRAKARMRRSRASQPDPPLTQPSRTTQSTPPKDAFPASPTSHSPRQNDEPSSPRSPRSPDDGGDRPPSSPSRSLLKKRRAEYRNRIRKSIDAGI